MNKGNCRTIYLISYIKCGGNNIYSYIFAYVYKLIQNGYMLGCRVGDFEPNGWLTYLKTVRVQHWLSTYWQSGALCTTSVTPHNVWDILNFVSYRLSSEKVSIWLEWVNGQPRVWLQAFLALKLLLFFSLRLWGFIPGGCLPDNQFSPTEPHRGHWQCHEDLP